MLLPMRKEPVSVCMRGGTRVVGNYEAHEVSGIILQFIKGELYARTFNVETLRRFSCCVYGYNDGFYDGTGRKFASIIQGFCYFQDGFPETSFYRVREIRLPLILRFLSGTVQILAVERSSQKFSPQIFEFEMMQCRFTSQVHLVVQG